MIPAYFSRWRANVAWRELGNQLGLIGGFVVPVLAALAYRTYTVAMTPNWYDLTRQLGFIVLAVEIVVIVRARRCGMQLGNVLSGLPQWAKVALVVFLGSFWLSSAFVSRFMPFSLMLSLGWIVQLLFAAGIHHFARAVPMIDLRGAARGFVLGLAAVAVMTVVHFTAFVGPLLNPNDYTIDWVAAVPGFISIRLFGAWCGAVMALLTGLAWRHDTTAGRRSLYLMLAFVFVLTFWSATRAALLGWTVALSVAWLLAGKPASRTVFTRLPFYLIAAAGVALALPPYDFGPRSFIRVGGLHSGDALASGRLTLWKTALRVAADYPLFGSGAGSSWWLVPLQGVYHVQPHNAVVQFLLNWGVIPTIPALVLLAGATWHAHRAARRCPDLLPVILMLDCLLTMSLFDGMLHFAQFIMLIFGCLAVCLSRLGPREAGSLDLRVASGA